MAFGNRFATMAAPTTKLRVAWVVVALALMLASLMVAHPAHADAVTGAHAGTDANTGATLTPGAALDVQVEPFVRGSGTCGPTLTWALYSDGRLVIEGTGAMPYDEWEDVPWAEKSSKVTSLIVSDGVTSIGRSTFAGCHNLTSAAIASSVTEVSDYAFAGCSLLTSGSFGNVTWSLDGSALTIAGEGRVPSCAYRVWQSHVDGAVESVYFSAGITAIDRDAFYCFHQLASVTFEQGSQLKSIHNQAFFGCYLNSVDFADSCVAQHYFMRRYPELCGEIKTDAATGLMYSLSPAGAWIEGAAEGVQCPRVPDSIEGQPVIAIAAEAFSGNTTLYTTAPRTTTLRSIALDDASGLKRIGDSAFEGCTTLTSADVPSSVVSIGSKAFSGCKALETAVLRGQDVALGSGCFADLPSGSTIYVVSDTMLGQLKGKKNFLDPAKTSVVKREGEFHLIATADVKVPAATYTGKAVRPAVTVTFGGKKLKEGTDYKLLWSDNVLAGTARVTAQGIGSYVGFAHQQFTIKRASIAGAKLVLSKTSFTYNTKAQRPTVKTVGGKKLKAGTDYALKCSSTSPKNAGTYKVWVVGKGNYAGASAKASYKIVAAKQPAKVKATAKTVKLANVKKKAQTVVPLSVKGAKGTVSYKKTGGAKQLTVNAKTGKVTVKKGAKKNTYKAKVQVKVAGGKNYKSLTKTVTVQVRVK